MKEMVWMLMYNVAGWWFLGEGQCRNSSAAGGLDCLMSTQPVRTLVPSLASLPVPDRRLSLTPSKINPSLAYAGPPSSIGKP